MSIEQLKKCFTTGNYRDALAIGESLLNDTTLTDDQKRHVLYCCTLCARYIEEPDFILYYFKLFSEHMPVAASLEQQIPFLHCKVAILFFANQHQQALELANSLLLTIKNLPNLHDYIYIYASVLHHKLLYFLNSGLYTQAVKTYNDLDKFMIEALEVSVPTLLMQIHGHLTSAYLRLAQWRTANELIQAMLQTPWLEKAPYIKAHLQIRENALHHILSGKDFSYDANHELFLICQPMSRITLSVFLGDIKALQAHSSSITTLYVEWENYLTAAPSGQELIAYLA